jgi:hypothetical protein
MQLAERRWWPGALASTLGIVLLVVGAGVLVFVWVKNGTGDADQLASVVGALLALAGGAITLGGRLLARRQAAGLPPTAEQIDQAVATLAGAVREQWIREALARSLGDPEPMPVRWRLTSPALMDDPTVVNPTGPVVFDGTSNNISELANAFQALPRQRLVIVGGPGVGKTTLAVQPTDVDSFGISRSLYPTMNMTCGSIVRTRASSS